MTEPTARAAPTRWARAALAVVLAAGVALRLWQALGNPSLWLDELALVRNVAHLPLLHLLTGPLEYDQVAPPGFLAASRLLATLFPDADWAFRVVPWLASVLSIPLVFAVGRRAAGDAAGVGAAALVALAPPLVSLAWVAKQYALDVFVTAALLLGALVLAQDPVPERRHLAALGSAGGALLFFSYPGVPVAAALGLAVALVWWTEGRADLPGRLAALGVPLAVGAALVTLLALRARSPETAEHMSLFWAAGFLDSPGALPGWLRGRVADVTQTAFLTAYPAVRGPGGLAWDLTLVAGVGVVHVLVARRRAGMILLAPFLAAVAAAAAHLYPLQGRTSLFLAPFLAVALAAGFDLAGRALGAVVARLRGGGAPPAARAAGALACAALPLLALARGTPPYGTEHTRPLLRQVSEARRPGDRVYSYYAANQAVDWYGSRFGLGHWDAGACHRGEPRAYLRELDRYRGEERVWIIVTHAVPLYREPEVILGYLGTIGRERARLDDQSDAFGTAAYLFDLSDPELLARSSALRFEVEEIPLDPRYGCGRGPHGLWRRPDRGADEPPGPERVSHAPPGAYLAPPGPGAPPRIGTGRR